MGCFEKNAKGLCGYKDCPKPYTSRESIYGRLCDEHLTIHLNNLERSQKEALAEIDAEILRELDMYCGIINYGPPMHEVTVSFTHKNVILNFDI